MSPVVSRENKPPDDWLTTEQVADLLGITPGSVRQNLPRRWGVRPQNDMWRQTEILDVLLERKKKGKAA